MLREVQRYAMRIEGMSFGHTSKICKVFRISFGCEATCRKVADEVSIDIVWMWNAYACTVEVLVRPRSGKDARSRQMEEPAREEPAVKIERQPMLSVREAYSKI